MEFKVHVFVCVCINKHTHILLECFFPEMDGKDIIYIIQEVNGIIYIDESHRRF